MQPTRLRRSFPRECCCPDKRSPGPRSSISLRSLVLGTHVAKTIGGDLVRIELIDEDSRLYVLLAGLLGAIIWNLITWYLGLPTSSSHALVGGYAGAAIVAYGGVDGLLKPRRLDQDARVHYCVPVDRHDVGRF